MKKVVISSVVVASIIFSGCGDSDDIQKEPSVTKEALGKQLFLDNNLSNTRSMACATCHDPEHAFVDARFQNEGDINPVKGALSVGDDGVALGGRNAPTATYAQFSPAFHQDEEGTYIGGQFHDGRSATLTEQAKGPFLDTAEMQMSDASAVVERVKENEEYISSFKTLYGETIFDDVNASYTAVADAIEAFESTPEFAPFDSKYDRFLEGNYTMTEEEDLGFSLFFSEKNTNCASCHTESGEPKEKKHELFTAFDYDNIGVPRNLEAVKAREELGLQEVGTIDLGLGGRSDVNDSAEYGKFKVATLRNIAVTAPYMHNGVFANLKTVIEFYDHMGAGDRPLNPETNLPWVATDVNATVNHEELEETKELTDEKIDGLIAFLKLLTDKKYEYLLEK